ncbi:acyl-CoA/acyl-ACP dehydrogenase [Streptomyces sp. ACA25]|uniref:acyl-CoA dehydrogenase family protein n=1 Tax=Streptomyces sp. ACA25 TaxID=3022596 RepID=UPI002307977C|nr:acyl-CoA dehydrogenase family protein [Streptomyces sp. ACA25]MDB1085986.1 acyl-CoA/acyl-ACP dehydrogenase [Streptomyces sp. ACA25]
MTSAPPPDSAFLARLRAVAREQAAPLRRVSCAVDADPALLPGLLDGALPWRQFAGLPAAYNPDPLRVDGRAVHLRWCAEQVVVWEELARADAGIALGLPGPAMSGHVMAELGDPQQLERYYGRLADGPVWTFFGMTEPAHGSDPAAMATTLTPADGGGLLLNGTKRFVGNGARSATGVLFARRHRGPLGVVAVLLESDRPGFTGVPLDTIGLRGLELSELRMRDVPVAEEDVLGRHRSATRQGMWAAVRTFNRYRPVVSCLALGVAQAAHDYVTGHRGDAHSAAAPRFAEFAAQLAGVRAMVLAAARSADHDPADGTLASAAKIRATRLAEDITTAAVRAFGPGARWEHPLLDKWARDARAFEFMEGTSNIQRLTLAQGYLHGRI